MSINKTFLTSLRKVFIYLFLSLLRGFFSCSLLFLSVSLYDFLLSLDEGSLNFWKQSGFYNFYRYQTEFFRICRYRKMVFCYQNCSELLGEKKFQVIEKNFWNCFEITRTIYSNSVRSEQFLVTECFLNLFLEVFHI